MAETSNRKKTQNSAEDSECGFHDAADVSLKLIYLNLLNDTIPALLVLIVLSLPLYGLLEDDDIRGLIGILALSGMAALLVVMLICALPLIWRSLKNRCPVHCRKKHVEGGHCETDPKGKNSVIPDPAAITDARIEILEINEDQPKLLNAPMLLVLLAAFFLFLLRLPLDAHGGSQYAVCEVTDDKNFVKQGDVYVYTADKTPTDINGEKKNLLIKCAGSEVVQTFRVRKLKSDFGVYEAEWIFYTGFIYWLAVFVCCLSITAVETKRGKLRFNNFIFCRELSALIISYRLCPQSAGQRTEDMMVHKNALLILRSELLDQVKALNTGDTLAVRIVQSGRILVHSANPPAPEGGS